MRAQHHGRASDNALLQAPLQPGDASLPEVELQRVLMLKHIGSSLMQTSSGNRSIKSSLLLLPLLCSFPHRQGAALAEHDRTFSHPQINRNSLSSSTTCASALPLATSNPPALPCYRCSQHVR
ncbi:unnamed protein product [Urochloa humidicola]